MIIPALCKLAKQPPDAPFPCPADLGLALDIRLRALDSDGERKMFIGDAWYELYLVIYLVTCGARQRTNVFVLFAPRSFLVP